MILCFLFHQKSGSLKADKFRFGTAPLQILLEYNWTVISVSGQTDWAIL